MIRFLRKIERKLKREKIKNEIYREQLQVKPIKYKKTCSAGICKMNDGRKTYNESLYVAKFWLKIEGENQEKAGRSRNSGKTEKY